MSLNFLIFIVIFLNTLLSLGVFLRNPKNKNNKFFSAFIVFLNLWIISNFLENEPDLIGLRNIEVFLRLDFVFAILGFYNWFRFCSFFTNNKLEFPTHYFWRRFLFFLSVMAAVLSLFTPWILKNVSFYDNIIHFENGVLWPVYGLLLLFFTLGGLFFLIREKIKLVREKRVQKQRQIDLILMGFFLSMGNAIFINFLQSFYSINLEISRFGLYGMTILVIFMSYAISNLKFFELKLALIKAIGFLFFDFLAVVIYALAVFAGIIFLFGIKVDFKFIIGGILISTGIVFTAKYIHIYAGKLTNRIFHKREYDINLLLAELMKIMVSTIDIDIMAAQIIDKLKKEMNLTEAVIFLIEEHNIKKLKHSDFNNQEIFSEKFEKNIFHGQFKERIICDELPEGDEKELFKKLNISIVTPLNIKEKEIAILILGSKISGEQYNASDFAFLNIFSPQLAIAIQNTETVSRIIKLDKEKSEIIKIISHQLRTPFTVIRWNLELAIETIKKNTDEYKTKIATIKQLIDDSYQTILIFNQALRDVISVFEIEENKIIMNYKTVDFIPEIIEKTINSLKYAVNNKNISINRVFSFNGSVKIDPMKIERAMEILINNAIVYSNPDSAITIKVAPETIDAENKISVSIEDNGIGVAKKDEDIIFQKFFRGDEARRISPNGFGLGLYIAKKYIELHDGKIYIEEKAGPGAIFSFSLSLKNKN